MKIAIFMKSSHISFKPPNEVDTLESYLEGIYVKIHKQKSAKELELRSLKSFTEHLRSNLPKNQIGFIEMLFPEGMKMLQRVYC